MGMLYGIWEDVPAEIADEVLHDDIPVGPPDDPETATADDDEDDE